MRALQEEAEKLQARDTWELNSVKEWAGRARDAEHKGMEILVGRISLSWSKRMRKAKGNIAFGGDLVTGESSSTAISSSLPQAHPALRPLKSWMHKV